MANHVRAKERAHFPPTRLEELAATPPRASSLEELSAPASHPTLDGSVVDHLLSPSECERLLRSAEQSGFSFWDERGESERSVAIRNAHTLEFEEEGLCADLWSRVKPHVPSVVDISDDQQRFELDLEGRWVACGLNPQLLINRYHTGGHFAPHVDGSTIVDFNHRSLYTVLLYLNDCESGGATQLLREEQGEATECAADGAKVARADHILYSVQPVCGRGLIYWHEVRVAVLSLSEFPCALSAAVRSHAFSFPCCEGSHVCTFPCCADSSVSGPLRGRFFMLASA